MHILSTILLSLLIASNAFGAASCQSDAATISNNIKTMYDAFAKGDIEPTMAMTDTSIIDFAGGREKFSAATKMALAAMSKQHYVMEKWSTEKPTQTYMAGEKSVCFVPTEMIMRMGEVRARAKNYLVAINRNTANAPWLFLDGNGFTKRPELLEKLVPGLPKNIKLPKNSIELIK